MAHIKNLTFLEYLILLAILVTVLCGIVYATAQQNYRQNADDPQIQLAEDIAAALNNGAPATAILPQGNIDLQKDLALFVTIYDDSGAVIASDGILNSKPPVLPSGVFDYVRNHGEDWFTYQPQKDVREAAVVTRYQDAKDQKSGFVLVGRSLKQIERRVKALGMQVLAGWLVCLALLLAAGIYGYKSPRHIG